MCDDTNGWLSYACAHSRCVVQHTLTVYLCYHMHWKTLFFSDGLILHPPTYTNSQDQHLIPKFVWRSQIYTRGTRTCIIYGDEFQGLQVFHVIKMTMVRQVQCCLHVTWFEHEGKQAQNAAQRAKIVDAFVLCSFLYEDPKFEPHGWRRHYTGWYRRSEISGVYLWWSLNYKLWDFFNMWILCNLGHCQ